MATLPHAAISRDGFRPATPAPYAGGAFVARRDYRMLADMSPPRPSPIMRCLHAAGVAAIV
jgi:hypothetical protein